MRNLKPMILPNSEASNLGGAGGDVDGKSSVADDLKVMESLLSETPENKDEEVEEKEEEETPESEEDEENEESPPESDEDNDEEEEEEGEEKEDQEPEPESEIGVKLEGKDLAVRLKKLDEKIFKKIPGLREAIFESYEYNKLFPSVSKAKEAVDNLRIMDQFEQSFMAGDSRLLLQNLSETNMDSYDKFCSNLLPTLFHGDQKMYVKVTMPIVKSLLRSVINEGAKLGGDQGKNLSLAGKVISKHLFDALEPPADPDDKKDPKQVKLDEERRAWELGRYTEFENGTHLKALHIVERHVGESLKEYKLSEFVKEALVERIIKETNNTLGKDRVHKTRIDDLWNKAKGNLSEESRSQIISAYLGGVRRVLPAIRRKLLSEVMSGGIRRGGSEPRKVLIHKKGKTSDAPTRQNPKDVDYSKDSDLDIINKMVKR